MYPAMLFNMKMNFSFLCVIYILYIYIVEVTFTSACCDTVFHIRQ